MLNKNKSSFLVLGNTKMVNQSIQCARWLWVETHITIKSSQKLLSPFSHHKYITFRLINNGPAIHWTIFSFFHSSNRQIDWFLSALLPATLRYHENSPDSQRWLTEIDPFPLRQVLISRLLRPPIHTHFFLSTFQINWTAAYPASVAEISPFMNSQWINDERCN